MSKKSNWLLGCGLGCAGLIAVIIIITIWGLSGLKDTRQGFDSAEEIRKNIEEKFGISGDFVPAADGSIPAERLKIFLAVRDATEEYRNNIIRFFESLPQGEADNMEFDSKPLGEKIGSIFQIFKSSIGMGSDIGYLLEARNQALLEKGMGIGEYTYIYVISYYSWLGHSPGDGPRKTRNPASWADRVRSKMHNDLLRMLSSQLDSSANVGNAEELGQWRSDLADEIEKMKRDEGRIPWQDSVPRIIAESLEPFRDRLEQAYSPITNPFELTISRR